MALAPNLSPLVKLQIYQQSALCTYKDDDLPLDSRLNAALAILQEIEDLDDNTNSRDAWPRGLDLPSKVASRSAAGEP